MVKLEAINTVCSWTCNGCAKQLNACLGTTFLKGFGLEYKEDYEEYDMEKIKFECHMRDLTDNGVLSVILLR